VVGSALVLLLPVAFIPLLGYAIEATRVAEQGLGLGLHAIRKRIDATGGLLTLETAPHRGTRVNASWKLAASAHALAGAAA